jgi:hypothetical protein
MERSERLGGPQRTLSSNNNLDQPVIWGDALLASTLS